MQKDTDNHENREAILAAAEWWSKRFQIDDLRERFKEALITVLVRDWEQSTLYASTHPGYVRSVQVNVDYDPCLILCVALAMVGVACPGFMFSAKGLFEGKTSSVILEGAFAVRDGRGAPWVDVFGVSGRAGT
jgi:hypothetical protein